MAKLFRRATGQTLLAVDYLCFGLLGTNGAVSQTITAMLNQQNRTEQNIECVLILGDVQPQRAAIVFSMKNEFNNSIVNMLSIRC